MSKTKKIVILVVGVVLAFIFLIYMGVAYYYKDRFFPGSTINGIDCSGRTVEDVEQTIVEDIMDYTLTVFMPDGSKEHILAVEMGMDYIPNDDIQELKDRQKNWLWIFSLFGKEEHAMSVETMYSKEDLDARIAQLSIFDSENIEEPQDAYIEFAVDKYVIVEEQQGNKPKEDMIYELVREAVDAGEPALNLGEYDCFEKPAITSDDKELNDQIAELNQFMEITITHEFGSRSEVLTGADMRSWVEISDDYEITVNEAYVVDYVQELASKYNTFGGTRTIASGKGGTVTIEGGDYGWVINKEAEVEALIEIIESGESTTREPVYEHTAQSREEKDWFDTYVEIDLGGQHLWYFIDGVVVVESDIVSGTMSTGHATREGTFPVMWKKENTRLVGETWDRPVGYFIPFYENVGLHDATWRSAFGGSIYQYSGSHGCINMPEDKVAEIYKTIQEGTPVFCYY